jgi:CRP-like cAMP-binding protein
MALALDPRANRILAALPETELRHWQHELEPVELSLGQVLFEPGKTPAHLYFPATAIVSLMYLVDGDVPAEIAIVGREGVAGVVLLMGDEVAPSRAVVQSAGLAYRLDGQALKHGSRRAPVLQLVLRFTQALITQMAQTAVCNRQHSLERRLCRWLLMSLDRLPGSELVMTQELIAAMLGVRREDVTEAASLLQGEGLIRYAPGRIAVLDREAMSLRACGCYAVVKQEYDRLLPARAAA